MIDVLTSEIRKFFKKSTFEFKTNEPNKKYKQEILFTNCF